MIKKNLFYLLSLSMLLLFACSDSDDNKGPEIPVTEYEGIVLNEICGLQAPDDDWVEIYNTTSQSVDLSNLELIKTDENGEKYSIYKFPANTIISAKQYLIIATLTNQLSAGISNSKQVGITLTTAHGKTIDSFDRDANIGEGLGHAVNGSYARLPNGTGGWKIVVNSTRGTENTMDEIDSDIDYSGIVLNEICGRQEPDDDWVEVYNSASENIDLSNVQIIKTDEEGVRRSIYVFPANSVLEAGRYMVIATLTGELTGGISNSKQVGIALQSPAGEIIDSFDRDTDLAEYVNHPEDGSYSRLPNGSGEWIVSMEHTRAKENKNEVNPYEINYEGLVLNEICGDQLPDDDWIEIYNGTTEDINLTGAQFIKTNEEDAKKTMFFFPSGYIIKAGEHKVIATETGELTSGISSWKQLGIRFVAATGKTIDDFDRDKHVGKDIVHVVDGSYSRLPDGTGDWKAVSPHTRGTKN